MSIASAIEERALLSVDRGWRGWSRLRGDAWGLAGLTLVCIFAALAVADLTGVLGQGWSRAGGEQWEGASFAHWFGTNRLGQDIFDRAVHGARVAFQVGLAVSLSACFLGALLGALAGWRPGALLDDLVLWLMGVLDSVPFYLFAAALVFALQGAEWGMYVAMIACFWTSTGRLVRAEVMRLRTLGFVESARAIGIPGFTVVFRHLLPNTSHLLLVQGTLTFVAAVKTEVILSFLGLGLRDSVSWGSMLAESTQDILSGHFGNFVGASTFLFALLLGLNLLADALHDAIDLRGVSL